MTRHIWPHNYEPGTPIVGTGDRIVVHNQSHTPFGPIIIDGGTVTGNHIGIHFSSNPSKWAGFKDVTIKNIRVHNITDDSNDCHGILLHGKFDGCELSSVNVSDVDGFTNRYASLLYARPEVGHIDIRGCEFGGGRGLKIRCSAYLEKNFVDAWIALDTYGKSSDDDPALFGMRNNELRGHRACIRADFDTDIYSGHDNVLTPGDHDLGRKYWIEGGEAPTHIEAESPAPPPEPEPPTDLEQRVATNEENIAAIIRDFNNHFHKITDVPLHSGPPFVEPPHNLTGGE